MIFKYNDNNLIYNIIGDDEGFPVFLNYGLIGSSDLPKSYNSILLKEKIKLIILERPGYGNSDFIKMRKYTDWNDILEKFLNYLNIQNFGVIGISAGAPYTYAMAEHFSKRLTGGVHILSGIPYILDKEIMNINTEENKLFYKKIWNYSQEDIQEEMYGIIKKYDKVLFKILLPKDFNKGVQDTLAQNCAGVGQSVRLQTNDWGFNPYDLESKIYLWHSSKDKEVPLKTVELMTSKMKNPQLKIMGNSHIPNKEIFIDVIKKIRENIE